MANRIVGFFGKLGGFLLSSLKRSSGTTDNGELMQDVFKTAGTYILAVEQETKFQKLPWEQKLKRAAELTFHHYAAQNINMTLHDIVAIVATKFVQINEEKISIGKLPLASVNAKLGKSDEMPPTDPFVSGVGQ